MHALPLHLNLKLKLLALAIGFVSAPGAEAAEFWVGVGPGCFSPDIQTAIDAAKLYRRPAFTAARSRRRTRRD